MFASLALWVLAAAQSPVFTIPLGKTPKQIEQPRAPVEIAGPEFDAICDDNDDWDKPAPPVRIHANTYLVGHVRNLRHPDYRKCGAYPASTRGTEAGADVVIQNIRALGLPPRGRENPAAQP